MSYLVGYPKKSISMAVRNMYAMYPPNCGYDKMRYAQCSIGVGCANCYMDKDLYRVCPLCGDSITKIHRIYECACGTIIYACIARAGGAIVTAYVTQNKLFRTEEDII